MCREAKGEVRECYHQEKEGFDGWFGHLGHANSQIPDILDSGGRGAILSDTKRRYYSTPRYLVSAFMPVLGQCSLKSSYKYFESKWVRSLTSGWGEVVWIFWRMKWVKTDSFGQWPLPLILHNEE
jgi:hypothetical protein